MLLVSAVLLPLLLCHGAVAAAAAADVGVAVDAVDRLAFATALQLAAPVGATGTDAASAGLLVVELGCGDGAALLRAVGESGGTLRAIGVDWRKDRVAAATANAKALGVADGGGAAFVHAPDFAAADVSAADIVIVSRAPLSRAPLAIQQSLFRQLRPGARIVTRDVAFNRTVFPPLLEADMRVHKEKGATTASAPPPSDGSRKKSKKKSRSFTLALYVVSDRRGSAVPVDVGGSCRFEVGGGAAVAAVMKRKSCSTVRHFRLLKTENDTLDTRRAGLPVLVRGATLLVTVEAKRRHVTSVAFAPVLGTPADLSTVPEMDVRVTGALPSFAGTPTKIEVLPWARLRLPDPSDLEDEEDVAAALGPLTYKVSKLALVPLNLTVSTRITKPGSKRQLRPSSASSDADDEVVDM